MDGSKFYHIRWCLNHNQKQMADDLGITLHRLRMYENDKKTIPTDIIARMEKHLDPFRPWMNL